MYVFKQKSYLDLKNRLDKQLTINANLAILTLPGMGITFCLKNYIATNANSPIKLITGQGEGLLALNILDFDLSQNPNRLGWVNEYFEKVIPGQRLILVVNSPFLWKTSEFANSYAARHIYDKYYFGTLNREDCDLLVLGSNSDLDKDDCSDIFEKSGGVARFAKYLAINWKKNYNWLEDKELVRIAQITGKEILRCSEEDKKLLNVERMGLMKEVPLDETIMISIDFDLSFTEDGVKSKEKLTELEKKIVEKMIAGGGKITKSEVSDIKWGVGKYDEFSDQAINKSMRRLGQKFQKYRILTIPKVGFQLKKRQ